MTGLVITFLGILVILGFILWDHHPPKRSSPPPAPTMTPMPPLPPKGNV